MLTCPIKNVFFVLYPETRTRYIIPVHNTRYIYLIYIGKGPSTRVYSEFQLTLNEIDIVRGYRKMQNVFRM